MISSSGKLKMKIYIQKAHHFVRVTEILDHRKAHSWLADSLRKYIEIRM